MTGYVSKEQAIQLGKEQHAREQDEYRQQKSYNPADSAQQNYNTQQSGNAVNTGRPMLDSALGYNSAYYNGYGNLPGYTKVKETLEGLEFINTEADGQYMPDNTKTVNAVETARHYGVTEREIEMAFNSSDHRLSRNVIERAASEAGHAAQNSYQKSFNERRNDAMKRVSPNLQEVDKQANKVGNSTDPSSAASDIQVLSDALKAIMSDMQKSGDLVNNSVAVTAFNTMFDKIQSKISKTVKLTNQLNYGAVAIYELMSPTKVTAPDNNGHIQIAGRIQWKDAYIKWWMSADYPNPDQDASLKTAFLIAYSICSNFGYLKSSDTGTISPADNSTADPSQMQIDTIQ